MNEITQALTTICLAIAVAIGVFGLSVDWDAHDAMLQIESN